jgi:hypothetical protein
VIPVPPATIPTCLTAAIGLRMFSNIPPPLYSMCPNGPCNRHHRSHEKESHSLADVFMSEAGQGAWIVIESPILRESMKRDILPPS